MIIHKAHLVEMYNRMGGTTLSFGDYRLEADVVFNKDKTDFKKLDFRVVKISTNEILNPNDDDNVMTTIWEELYQEVLDSEGDQSECHIFLCHCILYFNDKKGIPNYDFFENSCQYYWETILSDSNKEKKVRDYLDTRVKNS